MSLKDKINKMFEDSLPGGQDFGIYFQNGQHEEICIYDGCEWEVTDEYIYYSDNDKDDERKIVFPLNKVDFISTI